MIAQQLLCKARMKIKNNRTQERKFLRGKTGQDYGQERQVMINHVSGGKTCEAETMMGNLMQQILGYDVYPCLACFLFRINPPINRNLEKVRATLSNPGLQAIQLPPEFSVRTIIKITRRSQS